MKRLLFIIAPIILAIATFFGFSFFLSQGVSGKGALQVTSVPLSNVYLNGKLIGKTPFCMCEGKDLLKVGDYTLKLVPIEGDNLDAFEQQITITKSVLTVVDRTFGQGGLSSGFVINLVPLSDKNATQLFVSSIPSGAEIQVDQNEITQTPLLMKKIAPSDHDLVISRPGYKTKTVHIQTHAGYQLSAVVSLGLLPPNATTSANPFNNTTTLTPSQSQKIVILSTPTGYLKVRDEPSVSGSESAQVKSGNVYNLLDEQDGWYEINLTDGTNGWVSAQYARKQ
ncbi:MAG TPA: PEGA domain-containing protein [Patescibacteria group bacterium]